MTTTQLHMDEMLHGCAPSAFRQVLLLIGRDGARGRRRECGAAARDYPDRPPVHDVTVRSEEAWMASLELELLVAVRAKHRKVVGGDDTVAGHGVDEGRVRHLDRHPVTLAQEVDKRGGGEVGTAVTCDVEEAILDRHV